MSIVSDNNFYLNHPKDRQGTEKLWERFNVQRLRKEDFQDPYRHMLLREWTRVQGLGVDPLQARAVRLSSNVLEQLLEDESFLVECARRAFDMVRQRLSSISGMLIFADAEGTILLTSGDASIQLKAAEEINLVAGGQWSEASAGTNGIGTALARGVPVHVYSSEHYCEGWHGWTCAGAPVFDPFSQRVLGVVDFSTTESGYTQKATDLVTSLSRHISAEIRTRVDMERVQLLQQRDFLAPGLSSSSIVLYDRLGHQIRTGPDETIGNPAAPAVSGADVAVSKPLYLPGVTKPVGKLVIVGGTF